MSEYLDLRGSVAALQANARTEHDRGLLQRVELTVAHHQPTRPAAVNGQWWGCRSCGEPWPCGPWDLMSHELDLWIARAVEALIVQTQADMARYPDRKAKR